MTSPLSLENTFAVFRAYLRCFRQQVGARLWLAVALLAAISLLEGSSLLLLLPMLQTIGFKGSGQLGGLQGVAGGLLQNTGGPGRLASLLALLVAIKAAQAGLRACATIQSVTLETRFVCSLRDRFYQALMRSDWLSLTRERASDISQVLLGEIQLVGNGTQQLLLLASVSAVAAVQVLLAWQLSPAMTALALSSGFVVAFGLRYFRGRTMRLGHAGQRKRDDLAAAVNEHLSGMKIAKSHGREPQHFEHFRRVIEDIAQYILRIRRLNALTGVWLEVGATVALGFFIYLAVMVQHVSPAHLLVLGFIFMRLLSQASAMQSQWQAVAQMLPSFAAGERLRDRLVAAAEPAPQNPVAHIALQREIRLEGVSFRYSAEAAPALRGIDLVIPARRVTAFCGASGAGKSTLADILLGLLPPSSGSVFIDDVALSGQRLHEWRKSIGYVPQETFLFHETVRANLLWAQPDATIGEIRAALRAAAAEGFVDRLPRGLDTVVGDRGVRFSGGERQRLALARALLRQPTLLMLDEATSSLDTQNERLVQDAIERLHGEVTIVLIAHRLSTVRMADSIVVLEAGQIAESGTWAELSKSEDGVFHRLLAADAGC